MQALADEYAVCALFRIRGALAEFGATARDEVELTALIDRLKGVVEDTFQPEYVSVWLKGTTSQRTGVPPSGP